MDSIITWLCRYYAGEYLEKGMLYENLRVMQCKRKWKIVKRFIQTHEDDNGYGLTLTGKMYFNGDGFERNTKLARQYFTDASKLGNLDAMNFIAFMKWQGRARDVVEAERLFKYILERGDSNGANNLGRMYTELGRHAEAIEYYKIAVEMGNIFGPSNIATVLSVSDKIKYIRRCEEVIIKLNQQLRKFGQQRGVGDLVGISNNTIRSTYSKVKFQKYVENYMITKIEMEKIIKEHNIEALQTFLIRDQRPTAVNMLTDPYLSKYIGCLVVGKHCELF